MSFSTIAPIEPASADRGYKFAIDGLLRMADGAVDRTSELHHTHNLSHTKGQTSGGNGANSARRKRKHVLGKQVPAAPPLTSAHNSSQHNGQTHPAGEAQIRAVLESDFDPRVILRAVRNPAGRIYDFIFVEANEAACAYNGITRGLFVGRRLLELFPGARETGLFDRYCQILETQEPLDLQDFRYPHEIRSQTRRFHIRAVPLGDELHHTWRDVTDGADGQTSSSNHSPPEHHTASNVGSPLPLVLERRRTPAQTAGVAAHVRELEHLAQRLIESKEHQQQAISRELHDNIAQVLAAAANRISLAKDEKIPAWLRQELIDLREELKGALADVRTLAREMRPALLDHFGLVAALNKHADAFRERTRMTLDITLQPMAIDFLASGDLTHLFRLTQEALQNIEEHSRAERAWIRLHHHDGHLLLEIGDDGCSFTAERITQAQADGHLGLLGMRERAELIGGQFHLEAKPGQGTTIRIKVPPPPPQTARRKRR